MLQNKPILTLAVAASLAWGSTAWCETTPPPWSAAMTPASGTVPVEPPPGLMPTAPAAPVAETPKLATPPTTGVNTPAPWEQAQPGPAHPAPAPTQPNPPAPAPVAPIASVGTMPSGSMLDPAKNEPTAAAAGGLEGLSQAERDFLSSQSDINRQILSMQTLVQLQEQQNKYNELLAKARALETPQGAKDKAVAKDSEEGDGRTALQRRIMSDIFLLSVYGEGRDLTADVYYRGGRMTVQNGDTLPTGETVKRIEMSRMFVGKGKGSREIAMHSADLLNKDLGIKK